MRANVLVGAAGVVFAAASVVFVLAIHWRSEDINARLRQQHRTDVTLCRSARENRFVLRRILMLARNEVVHTPGVTPAARQRAFRFYRQTFRIASPIICPR